MGGMEERCKELINEGKQLYAEGRFAEALPVLRSALAVAEEGHLDKMILMCRVWKGDTHRAMGNPQVALDYYESAHASCTQLFGPDSMELAWLLRGMADALRSLGQLERAKQLISDFAAIYRRTHSKHRYGIVLKQIGVLLMAGNPDYAHLVAALSRFEDASLLMDHNTMNYAVLLDHMAQVLVDLDEMDRALEMRREQLDLLRRLKGPEHPDLALAMVGLAQIYSALNQVDSAVEWQEKATVILESKFGTDHRFTAQARSSLDLYRRAQKDEMLAESISIPERICRACSVIEEAEDVLTCEECHRVFYCSAECKAHDWESHQIVCRKRIKRTPAMQGD